MDPAGLGMRSGTPASEPYAATCALAASDIAAARAVAMAHGTPHYTIAWPIPAGLAPGDYLLVVSVEAAPGQLTELTRRVTFTILP
jgi:hypothetical protein